MFDDEEDLTTYKVVVNHEEQYSIWPVDRENPLGWEDRGPSGPKAECLVYINEVWTDMRPLSLRKHMEEVARQQAENPPPPSPPPTTEPPKPDGLVSPGPAHDQQCRGEAEPAVVARSPRHRFLPPPGSARLGGSPLLVRRSSSTGRRRHRPGRAAPPRLPGPPCAPTPGLA